MESTNPTNPTGGNITPAPATITGSFGAALSALTTPARIVTVVIVLVLMCGSCGIGSIAARGGGSQPVAQSGTTQQTATPSQPAATPTKPAPTATPKPKTWVTVQHFTGANNQQTPTFSLPDGSRIVWSAKAANQFGGNFIVEMYNADGTLSDQVANSITPPDQSGTYNVHGDQSVYLSIQTDGCNYDIAVQVYQ